MTQKQFPTWLHIFCIILILFVTLSHATTPASLTNQPVNVTFPTAYISFVPVKDTNSAVNYSTETSAEPKTLPTNTDFTNFTTEAYNTTTVEVTTRDYTTAGTTGGTTAANSDNSSLPKYVGFISAGVAVFLYGSNFAPVKKFETGDGKLKSCLFTFFKAMCLKSIPNQALIHVSENFLYLHPTFTFISHCRDVLSVDFVWGCPSGRNYSTGDSWHKSLLPTGNDRGFDMGNR